MAMLDVQMDAELKAAPETVKRQEGSFGQPNSTGDQRRISGILTALKWIPINTVEVTLRVEDALAGLCRCVGRLIKCRCTLNVL
jgi:hypothetical protein